MSPMDNVTSGGLFSEYQGSHGVVKVQLFDPSAVIVQYFDASAVFHFPLQL